MRLIPPIFRENNSNAEQKVFNLFKEVELNSRSVAFHSLNISEHEYKKWAEIDFILMTEIGVLGFEVKGGRVACEDGIWFFTDRYGQSHKKSHGPFEQVKIATYGLQSYLKKSINIDLDKYVMGWGVIFPDIEWSLDSPEMPNEIVCDKKFIKNSQSFEKYLKKVFNYWSKKNRKIKSFIDHQDFKKIEQQIRPNFDVAPSLSNTIDDVYKKIVRFTDEQYYYLDSIISADRIICSGGAGTGKSFLAVETAFREANQNKKVLITAFHPIFTEYLKKQFNKNDAVNIHIKIFSDISLDNTPSNFYDSIIVDEAQDILNFENLDLLNKILKNGIEKGRWRFFMDENSQAGILGSFDIDAYKYIYSLATYQKLAFNCRNTEQIVNEVEDSTGARLGETKIKGEGPKVEYVSVKNSEDEIFKISNHLEKLINNEVDMHDIAILSPVSYVDSVLNKINFKWTKFIKEIKKENISIEYKAQILFSSIKDFKGLERKHILIIDTDHFPEDDNEYKSLLYIGMTRAQANLWVAQYNQFEKILNEYQIFHAKEKLKNRS